MIEQDASILDHQGDSFFPKESTCSIRLRSGTFFVEGAKRAALYDTTNGNVYSLNREAAQAMKGDNNDPEF